MTRRAARPSPDMEAFDAAPDDGDGATWRGPARLVAGAAVAVALIVIAVTTLNRATADAGPLEAERTALEAIEIYAQGGFLALTAIGLGVALYIATWLDA